MLCIGISTGTGLLSFLSAYSPKTQLTDDISMKNKGNNPSDSGNSGNPNSKPSSNSNIMKSPYESVLLNYPELPPHQYSKSMVYYTPARLQVRTTVFQIHFMYFSIAWCLYLGLNLIKKPLGLLAIPLWANFQFTDVWNTSKIITDIVLHEDQRKVTIYYGVMLNRQSTAMIRDIRYLGTSLQEASEVFMISVKDETGNTRQLFLPDVKRVVPESMLSGFESWSLVNAILRGHEDEVVKYQKISRPPVISR